MTIIAQRILIPAAPETVWACVSDIDSNTRWQTECEAVSHLSSRRSGPGVRWRSTGPGRREQVLEITAWYDGLGYEYTVVDGLPFASAKGRIRLQEIPEGTIVQWTFTYETKGVAGSLRSGLGARRRIENAMVESLKNLWRHINQSGGTQHNHEAKSLIREALDYEARANYKPRHPSAFDEQSAKPDQPGPVIAEPPLTDEDTRPRPAVQPEAAIEPAAVESAPAPEAEAPPVDAIPERELEDRFAAPASPEPPAPIEAPVEAPAVEIAEAGLPEPEVAEAVLSEPESAAETLEPPDAPAPAAPPPPADTAHASIWEIFGVPPPSEAQSVPAGDSAPTAAAPAPAAQPAAEQGAPDTDEPVSPAEADAPAGAPPSPAATPQGGWRAAQRRTQVRARRR